MNGIEYLDKAETGTEGQGGLTVKGEGQGDLAMEGEERLKKVNG